ncbi:MAG: hypothetical protein HGA31_04160 [Candidatus Moranbacteria bacterium]|nr:hypothetical protein [Candidatus Moranbacteria bacterium]
MGQEPEERKRELIVALKHRNWLFAEMEHKVAAHGWKSRCVFSGLVVHCAVPEVAHHCLAGIRRQYAAAVKRVRAAQAACPEALEDPEVLGLEEVNRAARKKSETVSLAS